MGTIAWQKRPPKSGEIEFSLNSAPVSQQSSNRRKRQLTREVRKVFQSVEYILTGDIGLDIEWYLHEKVRYEILKRFGYFVTESSEHFAEYVPWFIKKNRNDVIEKSKVVKGNSYLHRTDTELGNSCDVQRFYLF